MASDAEDRVVGDVSLPVTVLKRVRKLGNEQVPLVTSRQEVLRRSATTSVEARGPESDESVVDRSALSQASIDPSGTATQSPLPLALAHGRARGAGNGSGRFRMGTGRQAKLSCQGRGWRRVGFRRSHAKTLLRDDDAPRIAGGDQQSTRFSLAASDAPLSRVARVARGRIKMKEPRQRPDSGGEARPGPGTRLDPRTCPTSRGRARDKPRRRREKAAPSEGNAPLRLPIVLARFSVVAPDLNPRANVSQLLRVVNSLLVTSAPRETASGTLPNLPVKVLRPCRTGADRPHAPAARGGGGTAVPPRRRPLPGSGRVGFLTTGPVARSAVVAPCRPRGRPRGCSAGANARSLGVRALRLGECAAVGLPGRPSLPSGIATVRPSEAAARAAGVRNDHGHGPAGTRTRTAPLRNREARHPPPATPCSRPAPR